MGMIQRTGDLIYTFRFLTLLVTPFEKTKAFELGIIDEEGKRIKSVKLDDREKKSAYTPFHRLVFNVKKLLAKAPGGKSSVASYAAALYLIKEKLDLSDSSIKKIIKETGYSPIDFLNEDSQWFISENYMLSPGVYRLKYDKVVNSTIEELVKAKDQIRVLPESYPIGEMFGLHIYEAEHIATRQKVYLTLEELIR